MFSKMRDFWCELSLSVMAEEMNPGAIQFTVIPRLATSLAMHFDIPINPDFEAA